VVNAWRHRFQRLAVRANSAFFVRRFTLIHSLVVLVAAALAWHGKDARLVAAVGAASLAVLASLYAGRFTPDGRFGVANALTVVRVLLVVVLSALREVGPFAASLVVAFLLLDGVDGWVARLPPSTASEFGARFDMETDALFVLAFGSKLAEVGRLGAWIIVPGLLRYAYAAAISIAPRLGEAPRSRFGRTVAGAMMTSLAVSAWPIEPLSEPLALVASTLVILSFARSLSQSLSARA
jgi:phosphatidylglycerophosphate synthase